MQAQLLEGEGYSADQWKCKYVASFLPENVAGHMAAFIAQEKPFVRDQQNLDRFEYCEQMLAESSDNTPSLGTLPLGGNNLITRVARLMMEKYVWPRNPGLGVKITLEKNIPIAVSFNSTLNGK